jgi:hypothetical protein
MKRTLLTLLSVLFCAITFAQSVPQGINYQALARDANGDVLMNQALTIQFSVISDITTSAVSWQEFHLVSTNDYGLYTVIIGQGTATSAGSSAAFDSINWGASNHLLKVEVDYGGGIFVDMGTTAFMSVPYALYSANPGPQGLQGVAGNDGVDGVDGIDGTNGVDGVDGINGIGGVTTAGTGIYIIGAGTAASPYQIYDISPCGRNIGDIYQGGVIFYLDASGCHGLIMAPTDQSTGIAWSNGFPIESTTAFASCVGCGYGNTSMIVHNQGAGSYAAKLCYDLSLGGKTDWYFPSKEELNLMHLAGIATHLGGLSFEYYWSSTEIDNSSAWTYYAQAGGQYFDQKQQLYYVRAIRAF